MVNIGSSVALGMILSIFNSALMEAGIILSIFNSALMVSYAITISCVLMHRLQGRPLPHARYALGKWGILVNTCALIYLIPVFIFSFFPAAPNPTPVNMNWACVMVGGVTILATIYYVVLGRKTFTPPNEIIEDYIKRNQDVSTSEKEVNGGIAEESGEGGKHMDM
jgi:amino acid transporter